MTSNQSKTGRSPLDNRDHLRVCHIRGINAIGCDIETAGASVLDVLDLGRLSDPVASAPDLAPALIGARAVTGARLNGERMTEVVADWQRFRLLSPSGGLVDARVISTPWTDLGSAIDLLEDLNYETVAGEPDDWHARHVEDLGPEVTNVDPFHQLVFMPDAGDEPDFESIQRLIYRADLDAIEEHSSIRHPEELNRRPGQLAAVGKFGSVLWGHQDYLDATLVLSAAITVSAQATVRSVQRSARTSLLDAKRLLASQADETKGDLRKLAAELGIDLAVGAEAQASISDLLPSLRVDAFHQALYSATDLREQIDSAGRLLDRLDAAVR